MWEDWFVHYLHPPCNTFWHNNSFHSEHANTEMCTSLLLKHTQHMQTATEGPYADYEHVGFHGDKDLYCGTV
jgi:hypothetical protein